MAKVASQRGLKVRSQARCIIHDPVNALATLSLGRPCSPAELYPRAPQLYVKGVGERTGGQGDGQDQKKIHIGQIPFRCDSGDIILQCNYALFVVARRQRQFQQVAITRWPSLCPGV
jgi:hypothetical protein